MTRRICLRVRGRVIDRDSPLFGKRVEVSITTRYDNQALKNFVVDANVINVRVVKQ